MTEVSDLYERSAVTLSIVVSPVNIWTSSVNTRMQKKNNASSSQQLSGMDNFLATGDSTSLRLPQRLDFYTYWSSSSHSASKRTRGTHNSHRFLLGYPFPTQLQLVTAPPAHRPKLPANDSKFFRSEIATPSILPLDVYLSHSQSWSGAGVFVCRRRNDVLRKLRLALKAWTLALDIL